MIRVTIITTKETLLKLRIFCCKILKKLSKKFNKKIKLFKEEDIKIVQEHLKKIKEENLRLENENKRLNFVITNYIRENELLEIDEVKEILNKKNIKEKFKKSQKTNIHKDKNMKKFIEKWKKVLQHSKLMKKLVVKI